MNYLFSIPVGKGLYAIYQSYKLPTLQVSEESPLLSDILPKLPEPSSFFGFSPIPLGWIVNRPQQSSETSNSQSSNHFWLGFFLGLLGSKL